MVTTQTTMAQTPADNAIKWRVAAELPAEPGMQHALGVAGPVTGVHHNKLLVAGGANFPIAMPWLGGAKKYHDTGFVFEIHDKKLKLLPVAGSLPFNLAYAACASTPKGVFYGGGENEKGLVKSTGLLVWEERGASGSFVNHPLPDLPAPITNASASFLDNHIFMAGGETAAGVSSQFLVLDLSAPEKGWTVLPQLPTAVSHSVLVAMNGASGGVYLIGGRAKEVSGISTIFSGVYQFDLHTNKWTGKSSLPYPLSAACGVAANDHEILIFGGDRGETFHKVELALAAIAAENNPEKKQALIAQKNIIQASHPGFTHQILVLDTRLDQWQIRETIPFDIGVTTTASKWGNDILIPSGEIKAGVRTPQILMGKMSIIK